jgi:hypothetical protein
VLCGKLMESFTFLEIDIAVKSSKVDLVKQFIQSVHN